MSPVTMRCIVSKSLSAAEAAVLRRHLVQHDAEREHVAAPVDGLPRHCSGDMYANLPLMMPDWVSTERSVGLGDAEVEHPWSRRRSRP
jgi:hypothetical protein